MYKGILYFETTLQEEFVDAPVIVRAKVLSERDENPDNPKLNRDWGSYYRLQVEEIFKGKPSQILTDFTERNSGGFYFDVGKDYMVFLAPVRKEEFVPHRTMRVKYGCGQTREWKDVSAKDRERLKNLVMTGELLPGKSGGQ